MTKQKALKRRVRGRMDKTGERYAAARRQVLAKSSDPASAEAPPSTPAAEFRGRQTPDELVIARTGHPWSHWLTVLGAWGAPDRSHTEIARFLNAEHGVDGWWAQELTVRYEMAVGRRQPGQRPDGFQISVSKTIGAPADRVFEAIVDERVRDAWLPGVELHQRTATPPRLARFDWPEHDSRLAVSIAAKGPERSALTVQHEKLPDAEVAERMKAYWRDRLAALKALLE